MLTLALNLKLPFDTDMIDAARRDCDLGKVHQFRVENEKVDPRVTALLAERGIGIAHVEAFVTPPKQLLHLHVDGPELNNIAKLNWCWGAWGSKMMWWKLKPGVEPTLQVTGIGTRYLTMNAADCVPIYSHQIGQPTLVNVGQPHSVFNMTAEPRWVLSLVLRDDHTGEPLKMDEAVTHLKDLAC